MHASNDVIMTTATNPEVLAICHAQGWCASADKMTKSEAEQVTSLSGAFEFSAIVHFDELQYFTNVTLSSYEFRQCTSMTRIALPNTATEIPYGCFNRCFSLVSCALPPYITRIGDLAFQACYQLALSAIPSGCRTIGNLAFYYCSSLTSMELPSEMAAINANAFSDCGSIATITCLATTAPTIASNAFANTGKSANTRTLRVPTGATGYDSGYWLDLQTRENYPFTIEYI